MRQAQSASHRGRRVLHIQLAAGLLSALGLTVINLLVYGTLFLMKGPLASSWLLDGPFFFRPPWDCADFYIPQGTEALCITVLLAGSWALLLRTARRQKSVN